MTQTNTMPKGQNESNDSISYRFNINERLMGKKEFRRKEIINAVINSSGFSIETIKRIRYMKFDSVQKPNYDVLQSFAKAFKCELKELETIKL